MHRRAAGQTHRGRDRQGGGAARGAGAHRLRHGLGAAHGIGHNRPDNGVITLVLPEGVPAEALIAGEAKAAAKGKPAAKLDDLAVKSEDGPMNARDYNNKQMGDACEMLVAAELTLAGVPALRVPDLWPDYDVIAQPPDRGLQRVSVKSRTPGRRHSALGFDPDTCDWLAVVLFEKGNRRIFVLPKDVAEAHSTWPPKAKKRRSCALRFSRLRELSRYEDNFKLDRDPAA